MNLPYMTTDTMIYLRQNLDSNLGLYNSKEAWVATHLNDTFEENSWYKESKISYVPIQLLTSDGSKNDAENSKRLYESLISLTPAQATDSRIWTYLTHTVYYEYMTERWMTKEENALGTVNRFFASNNRELIRNGIARLWWYGYLTFDAKRKDPYELTKFLLSNQNIAQSLLERNIGNNKEWLKIVLSCILKYKDDYPAIVKSDNIKKIGKYINYFGGVSILDLFDQHDTEQFILNIFKRLDLIPNIELTTKI